MRNQILYTDLAIDGGTKGILKRVNRLEARDSTSTLIFMEAVKKLAEAGGYKIERTFFIDRTCNRTPPAAGKKRWLALIIINPERKL